MLFVPPSIPFMVPSASAETYTVSNAPGSSTPGCENTNSCFIPNVLNIQVDDSVTWTNDDTSGHTITSGTPSGGSDGAFDSSIVAPGDSYSLTFPSADTYNYFCLIHPWMQGTVTVTPATTPAPTPTITVSTDKTSYQNEDIIHISVQVLNRASDEVVAIKINDPNGDIIWVQQATLTDSGIAEDYASTSISMTPQTGVYTVSATYGSVSDTLTFQFTKLDSTPTITTLPIECQYSPLVLDWVDSNTINAGETVVFTGRLICENGCKHSTVEIEIFERHFFSPKEILATAYTDANGEFSAPWVAKTT